MNRKKGFPKLFKKLGIYAFWLLVWQLKRRIERQEARQEAAEKAREEFETNLYESSLAAIALGAATAKAVQRNPDAH